MEKYHLLTHALHYTEPNIQHSRCYNINENINLLINTHLGTS